MFNRNTFTLILAVGCALGIYQLGTEPERHLVVAEETAVTSPLKTAADESSDEEVATEAVAEKVTLEDKQPSAPQFDLPFPDRVNLFRAPQRQGKGIVNKLNGKSETAIELLGFVNVEEPQVVLSVDGLVAAMSEGSSEYGIEVISIQPPSVVLKRGRQRWQASLNN